MSSRGLRQEIVRCVGVAGSAQGHFEALREFSAREWNAVLNWLDLSGLALAFWHRAVRLGREDVLPRNVSAVLQASSAENRRRVAIMTEEFGSLNRRMQRAGIEFAVWKGFALIPDYCPDATLRPTHDYDYLISPEGWEGAQSVLETAGYFRKPESGERAHVTFAPRAHPSQRPDPKNELYSANLPRKVELHLTPWDEQDFHISLATPERPLTRKVRRDWQGLSFYSLHPSDAFVFQILHAFQHILHNWCRLGWLLEIAYFLNTRAKDSAFWEQLTKSLEANPVLAEIVALVTSLATELFGAQLPAAVESQASGAMRSQVALWARHYGIRSAIDNFCKDKSSLLLYREFVPDESVWKQIRRSRLLPVHRPNRAPVAAAVSRSRLIPQRWIQAWYVMRRLIHHSLRGASYTWESARWSRLRRLSADRVLSQG